MIKGEGNTRVRLMLDTVDYDCETTCHSFLEIKHNSDFQQIGFRAWLVVVWKGMKKIVKD